MNATETAIFVLKILLTLGPVAVYFLILGLVNSQARPCLVSARADFALLALVFVPVMALPLFVLAGLGLHVLVGGVALGLGAFFLGLLPGRNRDWVIYNCGFVQCRRLLTQACRRLGWRADWSSEGTLDIASVALNVHPAVLPLLRSVTLHITISTDEQRLAANRLIDALNDEIRDEAMLPSSAGVSLVVLGTVLLGLPMWYLFHNIHAIVEVVGRVLSA